MKKLMTAAICLCGLTAATIQAATYEGAAVKDTYIIGSDGAMDLNRGHDGRLIFMDQHPEIGDDFRVLMQFDLPGSLAGTTVNSATLSFDSWYGVPQTINVHGMAHDWVEGTGNYVPGTGYVNAGSGASWNSYEGVDAGNDPWPGGAGAMGDTIGPGNVYGTVVVSSHDETPATLVTYEVEITDLVQLWADGAPNYGLMFEEASSSSGHRYGSSNLAEGYDEERGIAWKPPTLNIEYGASLIGDANRNGEVGADDAAILADNWLATGATWGMGDFNVDGVVDDKDATLMATNWGKTTPGSAASVPEPSLLVLCCAAVVMLALGRKIGHR